MKTTLKINLQQLFATTSERNQIIIRPSIKMAQGNVSYYQNQIDEAILQEFDGLLGFINTLDFKLIAKTTIPLHIKQSDLHIFYLMEGRSHIVIHDLQTSKSIAVLPLRGRYFYLPAGRYELTIPHGRSCICNFYFRCSIFRDGNERPYQFLHPLIEAHRTAATKTCYSIDFRVGPRTRARIHYLLGKLKKGDLDNEKHILQELHELIKLSGQKIFEEYHKLSGSLLKAREARDLIVYAVEQDGQNFGINSIAEKVEISYDYLHEIFHRHFNQSPNSFKYILLEEKIKNLLLEGLPVVRIAYICGYPDGSGLTKFFKKRTGLTPTEFLNSQNTEDLGYP